MRKNNSRFLFVLASLLVVLVVAPDPVARYDVWDLAGYFGSVSHRRWLHFHNRLQQVRVRQQRLIHFAIAGCICLEKWLRLCFTLRSGNHLELLHIPISYILS